MVLAGFQGRCRGACTVSLRACASKRVAVVSRFTGVMWGATSLSLRVPGVRLVLSSCIFGLLTLFGVVAFFILNFTCNRATTQQ